MVVAKNFNWSLIKKVLIVILLIIIIVAVFTPRSVNTTLTAGVGINAHLGNLSGNLNLETFENNGSAVLFYAPWCGHCKTIMPEWDNLGKSNTSSVTISKVNCDEQPDLANKHGVNGFPTIKYLPNGINDSAGGVTYEGERNSQALVNWLQSIAPASGTGGPNAGKSAQVNFQGVA